MDGVQQYEMEKGEFNLSSLLFSWKDTNDGSILYETLIKKHSF